MSNSRKKKKKAGRAKKVVITLLCLIVLAALGLSIAGNVILHEKISEYTDGKEPPFDGGNVIVTPIDPAPGIALLSMDSTALLVSEEETADFLVTVTPDVNMTVKIDWSIGFTNPESEWAKGKYVTDYATVIPTRDGALTANISVIKQAFGEQITVKASVRSYEDVFVNCTVDYVCKYAMQGFEIEKVENAYNESSARITPILTKSIGTIDEEITQTITLGMNDNFKSFYSDVIAPARLEYSDSKTSYLDNYFNNFIETGTNELVTNLYGYVGFNAVIAQNAFGYLDLNSDRYKVHMERFFGYMLPSCIPANPDFKVLLQSIQKYERYSNEYISADTANAVNNLINTGLSRIATSNSYGFSEAQGGTSSTKFYSIANAFYIQYECHNDYNSISYKENFAFVFKEFPVTAGSLTIDPPSIIV